MKALIPTTMLALSVLLAACQGSNPFKFQANPAEGNPSLSNPTSLNAWAGDHKAVPQVTQNNTQLYCQAPLVTIVDNVPSMALNFVYGEQKTHHVHIQNMLGTAFTVKYAMPAGVEVSGSSKSNGSTLDFDVRWTPGQNSTSTSGSAVASFSTKTDCGDMATAAFDFNVNSKVVQNTAPVPMIEKIDGIPQTVQPYSDHPQSFTVSVKNAAPGTLVKGVFEKYQNNSEHGDNQVVDASAGVNCSDISNNVSTCVIDKSKIKLFQESGKTFNYAFSAVLVDGKGNRLTAAKPAAPLRMHFPTKQEIQAAAKPVVKPDAAPAPAKVESTPAAPAAKPTDAKA